MTDNMEDIPVNKDSVKDALEYTDLLFASKLEEVTNDIIEFKEKGNALQKTHCDDKDSYVTIKKMTNKYIQLEKNATDYLDWLNKKHSVIKKLLVRLSSFDIQIQNDVSKGFNKNNHKWR
ncbi:hypothetical protein JW868_03400 [Candidatus Woesearchaeota archaeon]|nr:hypothetical protein [Candidatus Woesearchaeota archaeon]